MRSESGQQRFAVTDARGTKPNKNPLTKVLGNPKTFFQEGFWWVRAKPGVLPPHERKQMTGKERAALRKEANKLTAIQQIGHGGIGEEFVKNTDAALTARELVKMKVLETSPVDAREAADTLASELGAEVIQVIGRCFVLYRFNPDKH